MEISYPGTLSKALLNKHTHTLCQPVLAQPLIYWYVQRIVINEHLMVISTPCWQSAKLHHQRNKPCPPTTTSSQSTTLENGRNTGFEHNGRDATPLSHFCDRWTWSKRGWARLISLVMKLSHLPLHFRHTWSNGDLLRVKHIGSLYMMHVKSEVIRMEYTRASMPNGFSA